MTKKTNPPKIEGEPKVKPGELYVSEVSETGVPKTPRVELNKEGENVTVPNEMSDIDSKIGTVHPYSEADGLGTINAGGDREQIEIESDQEPVFPISEMKPLQVSKADAMNKTSDILSKEYGTDKNVTIDDNGVWWYNNGGRFERITNADGSYNLKNGKVLRDGNIYDAENYDNAKYDITTREGRRKKGADRVQQAYNDLRDILGREPSDSELYSQLGELGVSKFNAENGIKSWFAISRATKDKLESNYQKANGNDSSNELSSSMNITRDRYGKLRKDLPVAIINGKSKTRSDADALRRDLMGFVHDNPYGTLNEEQTTRLHDILVRHGMEGLPKDAVGTASGLLSMVMNGDEAVADFIDETGINLDGDTITFEDKDVDLDGLLNEYREKKELDTKKMLDEKAAERRRAFTAFSNVFEGIGDTIRAAYGAKVFDRDGGKAMYDQINNDVKQKAQIYEAKMQALKDKALEEKRRQEAIALEKAKIEDQQRHEEAMQETDLTTKWRMNEENNNTSRANERDKRNREEAKNMVPLKMTKTDTEVYLTDKNKKPAVDSVANRILGKYLSSDILSSLFADWKEGNQFDVFNRAMGTAESQPNLINKDYIIKEVFPELKDSEKIPQNITLEDIIGTWTTDKNGKVTHTPGKYPKYKKIVYDTAVKKLENMLLDEIEGLPGISINRPQVKKKNPFER